MYRAEEKNISLSAFRRVRRGQAEISQKAAGIGNEIRPSNQNGFWNVAKSPSYLQAVGQESNYWPAISALPLG
jgi:hypothetical protein